jgi:site-specific recombinase XerD
VTLGRGTEQLDLHDDPAVRGTRPPEPLTLAEVRALMAAPSRRSSAGIRDRALMAVALRGGLRLAELLDLDVRDVDLDEFLVRVRHGKGDKSRVVAIDATTRDLVVAWITRRAALIGRRKAPLFCTYSKGRPPGRLDDSYVRRALRRYGKRAGIARKVHPHGLRHTFTVTAVREGVNLAALQLQLGHSDLRTTSVYVRGLDPVADLAPLRNRSWDLETPSG